MLSQPFLKVVSSSSISSRSNSNNNNISVSASARDRQNSVVRGGGLSEVVVLRREKRRRRRSNDAALVVASTNTLRTEDAFCGCSSKSRLYRLKVCPGKGGGGGGSSSSLSSSDFNVFAAKTTDDAVSYTHLTLPTILLV